MSEFEKKASEVLSGVQKSMNRIISFFGDPAVVRPVDLRDLMGLDMNLAWKISRLVNTADVFSLGKYLPGKKAIHTFALKACEAGIPKEDIKRLEDASMELEWLVRSCAGSRKELEVMLAGLSTEERTGNDSLHRRKSFEGNSFTFGVQSDVQLSTSILMVSDKTPGSVDICRIKGQIFLYRTRPEVPWRVAGTSILDADGKLKPSKDRDYLYPVEKNKPPVLREFSSPNLPEFGSVTDRTGRTSYYLKGSEMGLLSSIDIFTADIIRNTGHLYRKNPNEGVALNNSSRTPTRRFTVEVYLPEEFSGSPWEVEMWSLLFPVSDHSGMTPGDRLPLAEQPVRFNPGRSPVPLAGVPVYSQMISSCFDRIGRDIGNYSLLRLSVDYPPIPASIDFLVALPEDPERG